jgi:hypothetical protein
MLTRRSFRSVARVRARAELARVEIFVDARDLAIAALRDDARRQRRSPARVCNDVDRVLHDEARLERIDDAIVVGPPAMQRGAVAKHCQVLVSGNFLAGDVDPQLHAGGVEVRDGVDVGALDRVEEAVTQLP